MEQGQTISFVTELKFDMILEKENRLTVCNGKSIDKLIGK